MTKAIQITFLALWSLLMTGLTFVFGGVFLRGLRVVAGENLYWTIGIGVSAAILAIGWPLFALFYFGLVLLIGVFSDLEEKGYDVTGAGLISSGFLFLAGGGLFAFWVSRQGSDWLQNLVTRFEESIQTALPNMQLPIPAEEIVKNAPSLIFMIFGTALLFALLLENRVTKPFVRRSVNPRKLIFFRVPDFFIWIFLPSVLLTFGKFEEFKKYEWIASNIFNICFFLYFFQGLAVVASLFKRMKVSVIWRTLLMLFVALQLFVFVGVIGFADYWLDFRKKMRREAAGLKKTIFKNK